MPRADQAVIVKNELLDGPEGAPKVRVRWYSNGVISVTVLKGSPMVLERSTPEASATTSSSRSSQTSGEQCWWEI